jgi:hypothetical protein
LLNNSQYSYYHIHKPIEERTIHNTWSSGGTWFYKIENEPPQGQREYLLELIKTKPDWELKEKIKENKLISRWKNLEI